MLTDKKQSSVKKSSFETLARLVVQKERSFCNKILPFPIELAINEEDLPEGSGRLETQESSRPMVNYNQPEDNKASFLQREQSDSSEDLPEMRGRLDTDDSVGLKTEERPRPSVNSNQTTHISFIVADAQTTKLRISSPRLSLPSKPNDDEDDAAPTPITKSDVKKTTRRLSLPPTRLN